ncbi:MAG: lytic transglycosylase [Deltaproteobacteria bacterium]|nr:MAG: lytic transglycosylase [Deltaproteobacteria bacterium]
MPYPFREVLVEKKGPDTRSGVNLFIAPDNQNNKRSLILHHQMISRRTTPPTPLFFVLAVCLFFSGCNSLTQLTQIETPESVPADEMYQPTEDSTQNDQDLAETEPLLCSDNSLPELKIAELWQVDQEPVSSSLENGIFQHEYDFPVVLNKQVAAYLNLFQGRQKKQFTRWLARSEKYREIITEELEKAGLPKDLFYLAMIESGYSEIARSHSGAVGLWQFMKGTGRDYNLRINNDIDERRDPVKSTRAAVGFLSDLYQEFGDWYLAVAAYNAGMGKVRSGLKRYKVDSFWDLAAKKHLRLETKGYVPKLIAALLIAKNPEKYGFHDIAYQKPLRYDTITVGPRMSLKAIALVSGTPLKEIKALNHELRRQRTPANMAKYQVRIPYGKEALAKSNMSRLHSYVTTGYKTHTIRKGDTLGKICRRYAINKTTLLKVNNLRSAKLPIGRNLRIPYNIVSYQLLPPGSSETMLAHRDRLILHRVKKGDTVLGISHKYGVPPEMIVAWNGLKNSHSIRTGQQLALYIEKDGSSAQNIGTRVAKNEQKHLPVLYAHKKMRPAENNRNFQYYNVRPGDSLWSISQKFGIQTKDIKRWNSLKSNLIRPGITLKIKTG